MPSYWSLSNCWENTKRHSTESLGRRRKKWYKEILESQLNERVGEEQAYVLSVHSMAMADAFDKSKVK